jgi:NAD(P)-dependent dehydrogenase (short-subunit alcohol dehydrogenase family)
MLPRNALVTGAGRRIGRAIAIDLAGRGWGVGVHYNTSAAEAEAVVGEIAGAGGRAVALPADLRREDQTAALVDAAAAALGPVTCLVNNASVFEDDRALTTTRASWDLHLEVNLRAPFVLIQKLAAQVPDGVQGSVVNLLDQRIRRPTPFFVSYTVSKAGLWVLTQTLAMALAPRLRVNAVGPGPTLPSSRQTDEQFVRQWSRTPLRRAVAPQEICEAVRFLLDAPSITGQIIIVDAGQHLGWTGSAAAQPADE